MYYWLLKSDGLDCSFQKVSRDGWMIYLFIYLLMHNLIIQGQGTYW